MNGLELVVVLLAVSAALRLLARALNVPHPALLVLGGLVLATIPNIPKVELPPDVLFLVFIPPLLYWASFTTSLREFKAQSAPIIRFATVVVLMTMAAVAVVAHSLVPGFTWAAAFALGAIVSPPDPVAAIAVLRPLGAPRNLVAILEGEGLVNDATALVCYQVAVAAVVTGTFSPGLASLRILITGVGGVAVGLGIGWLIALVRQRIIGRFPIVENTLSLLTPFFAYLPAEWLQVSGVLSVVAVGLYLGRFGPRIVSPPTRIQAEGMWTMIQFLLESLVFILVGLELREVNGTLQSHPWKDLAIGAGAILATLIVVRLLYTFGSFLVLWAMHRKDPAQIPVWREFAFVGWTGMRGGDSLVIALALPMKTQSGAAFPARDLILFFSFAAILGTLVLQGFTLAPVLRWLRLEQSDDDEREEAHARANAGRAGLRKLEELHATHHPLAVQALRKKYGAHLSRWESRDSRPDTVADSDVERKAGSYRLLRTEMIAAERDIVIQMRDRSEISDDVMRRIQRDLDLESMLLEAAEDDSPESPYEEV